MEAKGKLGRRPGPALALITALFAWTVSPASEEPGGERATPDAPGCLFTISTPSNTVFLLGSMHYGTDDIYPLPGSVDRAYRESERVVFEIPADSMSSPSAQARLMGAAVYDDGSKLSDHVPKALYDELIQEAKQLDLPEAALQPFRPWMAGMFVGLTALTREGYDPNLGIEAHLFSRARADGKATDALETVDFQIGLFDNLSEEQSLATLRRALLDLDRIDELAGGLDDLWLAGDVDSLAVLTNESLAGMPELARALVYERNAAWVPAIEGWIGNSEDVLVVVGAGHLGGEGGLIDLLRERGHEVRGPGITVGMPR